MFFTAFGGLVDFLGKLDVPQNGEERRTPRSAIILADGVEDVQRLQALGERGDAVLDVAGNAVHVAFLQGSVLVADVENRLALQDHADLFVRVAVLGDLRSGQNVHRTKASSCPRRRWRW